MRAMTEETNSRSPKKGVKPSIVLLTCVAILYLLLLNLRNGTFSCGSSSSQILSVMDEASLAFNGDGHVRNDARTFSHGPTHEILPKRHITVVGLESSGTTFVTKLLSNITGIPYREGLVGSTTNRTWLAAPNRPYEILHLSLPWGNLCTEYSSQTIVDVMYPNPCIYWKLGVEVEPQVRAQMEASPACQEIMGKESLVILPARFFVNITSHVRWYRRRGVISTAVIVVRDKTMGHYARSLSHCPDPDLVAQEEAVGLDLIRHALDRLPVLYPGEKPRTPPMVVVSYESLLHLGQPYLDSILRELELPIDYELVTTRTFQDANVKYVKDWKSVKNEARIRAYSERYSLAVSAAEEFGRSVPPKGEDWSNLKDVGEEPIDDDLIAIF